VSAVAEKDQVNHLETRRKITKERESALRARASKEASDAATKTRKAPQKRALLLLLEDRFPNYQPVLEMASKAHRLSEIADSRPNDSIAQMDSVNAHEKVAKYVTPQLKAIDLTSGGEQIQFGFQLNLAVVPGKGA